MYSFLLVLRKCVAVLFTACGFAASALCLCGFGFYTMQWYRAGPLDPHDHGLWIVSGVLGPVCLVVFAAGIMLLRPAPAKGESAFTKSAGPQRRYAAGSAVYRTVLWPVLGVLWFHILRLPADPASPLGAGLAGFLGLYFGIHLFIFCHELGHFGMAALLRMDLGRLQVGTGPVLLSGRIGGVRFEWRALHGGGFVHAGSTEERGWRLRRWLMIAGGPAAHAAACALLAAWLRQHAGPNWWRDGWSDAPGFFTLALFYFEAYRVLLALLPRAGYVDARPMHTDGYWLVRVPFLSREAVRKNIVVTALHFAERLWEDGRCDDAREQIRRIQARYPDDPAHALAEGYFLAQEGRHAAAAASFRQRLAAGGLPAAMHQRLAGDCFLALVRSGDAEAARQFCADLLRETAPEARASILDAFATNVVIDGQNAFLPDADAWTQEMLALVPGKVTHHGTRGAVLVELGRTDEGEAMLREVWRNSKGASDAAISAFYLGVAARNQGQEREMRHWRKRALDFRTVLARPFLKRIETELVFAPPPT